MWGFEQKVVVVTGGNRGIGRGIVEEFANAGANVCFTYLNQEESAKELEVQYKGVTDIKVEGFCVDGRVESDVKAFVEQVLKQYGKIDVLVNNAAFISRRNFEDMNEEVWNKSIETNLNATGYFCKYVLNSMKSHNAGAIINISTVCAEQPCRGQAAYSSTKAAIEALSKVLALEYGPNHIRVNVVAPGFIMSGTPKQKHMTEEQVQNVEDSIPLKRSGYPKDVANAVLFLASEKASYITGDVIHITGGNHLKC
nr:SDR family NAD(P)-dependent oxidoreductase [uncultured Lachnoclostridium sp.]